MSTQDDALRMSTERTAMMTTLADTEWSARTTLENDLASALSAAGAPMLFSDRHRVAEHLWNAGYRPTSEAITRVREYQRTALKVEG